MSATPSWAPSAPPRAPQQPSPSRAPTSSAPLASKALPGVPSRAPSRAPSEAPSRAPSRAPSAAPLPSRAPVSRAPSKPPSQAPSRPPSAAPGPTRAPYPASIFPGTTTTTTTTPSSSRPSGTAVTATPSRRPILTAVPEGASTPTPTVPPPPSSFPSLSRLPGRTEILNGPRTRPPPSATPRASVLPPTTLKSVYREPEDLARAEMQEAYAELPAAERAEQDQWAMEKANEFAPCPHSWPWKRHPDNAGYQCEGGAHFMSDALLSEGVPGLYVNRYAHPGYAGVDRAPTADERVPYGYWGPIRPLGRDGDGNFCYFACKVNLAKTMEYGPVDERGLLKWS